MKMLQVSKCLIGLAVMVLQSCDVAENRRDLLCGNWESVEGEAVFESLFKISINSSPVIVSFSYR